MIVSFCQKQSHSLDEKSKQPKPIALQDNYAGVVDRAEAALAQFIDFRDRIVAGLRELNVSPDDKVFGGLFNVDWDGALVYPGELLDPVGIITDLPPLPTLDGIWAAVRPVVDLAARRIDLASLDTSLRALQWAQALEAGLAALDVAPDDYDPPRYLGGDGAPMSVEAEVAAHDAMADTFVARTATSLDAFDSYNQYVDSGGGAGGNASQGNASFVLEGLPSFDFSFNLKASCMCGMVGWDGKESLTHKLTHPIHPSTPLQYETLESPDLDVDALLRLFDRLPSLAFLTDYAYRACGSLRILWKFRTQTARKLPTVDLCSHGTALHSLSRGAEACLDLSQAVNPRRLLARLLASRYLPYLLTAGILLPLLLYGVLLYVAAYRDYQRGCVFNTNPRGTAWGGCLIVRRSTTPDARDRSPEPSHHLIYTAPSSHHITQARTPRGPPTRSPSTSRPTRGTRPCTTASRATTSAAPSTAPTTARPPRARSSTPSGTSPPCAPPGKTPGAKCGSWAGAST